MLPPIVIDIFAWTIFSFWLTSWLQNLLALILAQFYFRTKHNDKNENNKPVMANSALGVSIIKPLTGSDDHLCHNLESWFNIDYPLFEILFSVHSPNDSAVPIVFELMKRYPHVDTKLIVSETTPPTVILANGATYSTKPACCNRVTPLKSEKSATISDESSVYCFCSSCFASPANDIVNPKIKNMLPAYEIAKYGLIFLSDCYIEAERDSLRDVVQEMGPRVGTVCQMYWCKDPPTPDRATFGSVVNKVLFGTHNAKSILALYFINVTATVGAAMLIRKKALEECGGLRPFGRYLAEDFHIGLAVAKKGWANRLGHRLAWQNPAKTSVSDVFARIVRWKRLRQTTMPILILVEPLLDCMVLAITAPLALAYLSGAGALFPFWTCATTHLIAWFFVDYFLLSTIEKKTLPFSKVTFLLAWLTREIAFPFLHISAMKSRCVSWRNQHFRIRLGGLTERIKQHNAKSTVITPSPNHQYFAVKSFTSTPSSDSGINNSNSAVIDFVQESPIIEETPSASTKKHQIEPLLGGKLSSSFYPSPSSADVVVVNNSIKRGSAHFKVATTYWQNFNKSTTTPMQHQQRQS